MSEETITINRGVYYALKEDSRFLRELENAGVDNWEGYSIAYRAFIDSNDD